MRSKFIIFVLLLGFYSVASYGQKELWGEMNTTSPYDVPSYPYGALIKTDSIGNSLSFVQIFDTAHGGTPVAALLQASNGKIYGVTLGGGTANGGTLFEYDLTIDSFRVLINFGTTAFPYTRPSSALIEAFPGLLYGTCADGVGIFIYNIAADTIHLATVIPSFTSGLETIPNSATGSLYKASDGYIYGTTANYSDNPAGSPFAGSVFKIDPATNAFSYVHPFSGFLTDGTNAMGSFVEAAGKIYTTTDGAGAYALLSGWGGTVIQYDLSAHTFTKKMDFSDFTTGDSTGVAPTAFTKASNGKLYGYAYSNSAPGPIYKDATLFEYDPATNIYSHKYDFYFNMGGVDAGDVGFYPMGLMQASNGKFYGGTHETGLFEYDAATDSMRPTTARIRDGRWQPFIEVCHKPVYKYYSNTNDTACLGGPFQFDLHNTNAQTYVWRHNGLTDPTQTTGILHFASFLPADTGTWACTLTNECGVTTPPAIHIALSPLSYAGFIAGAPAVCVGSSITLSDTASGGVWGSSSAIATVSGGIVTGITAGTDTITYTIPLTCGLPTKIITINPLPGSAGVITGAGVVCAGATMTLGDASASGVWSSSTTAMATVGSTGVVTGVAAGDVVISYSVINVCGTNVATKHVTVNPLPVAGTITGSSVVCPASPAVLSDPATGGIWSSSASGIATVGSTGTVTAVTAGTATISYSVTNSCGTAVATKPVTAGLFPVAGTITGASTMCQSTITPLSDPIAGGIWSSSATGTATVGSTGAVTGVAGGTAIISYSVTNICGTTVATTTMTVNPRPTVSPIAGDTTVCVGATTLLTDTATGGTWNSSVLGVATISSTGAVTGISPGTTVIVYYTINTCAAAVASVTVTVTSSPSAGSITGTPTLCEGSTTSLMDTATGGAWSSSSTSIATVGSTGIVTGASGGSAVISYSVTNSCGTAFVTMPVTVNPLPLAGTITGSGIVCAGDTIILSDAVTGGAWSSSVTGIATVDGTGAVTGVAAGSATMSYSVTNSCGTVAATMIITVNTLATAGTITGTSAICTDVTTLLTDLVTGGVWSSDVTGTATVDRTGAVTGVTAGTTTISYSVTNSCGTVAAVTIVTVNPLPVAGTITGIDSMCPGDTALLSHSIAGGIWSSNYPSIAAISAAGLVTGLTPGTDTIAYIVFNSCDTAIVTFPLTVRPSSVCAEGENTIKNAGNNVVAIHPNPATSELAIEINKGAYTSFTIANNIGQAMIVQQINTVQTIVNVAALPAGLYFITLNGDHGIKTVKFVKM